MGERQAVSNQISDLFKQHLCEVQSMCDELRYEAEFERESQGLPPLTTDPDTVVPVTLSKRRRGTSRRMELGESLRVTFEGFVSKYCDIPIEQLQPGATVAPTNSATPMTTTPTTSSAWP